MRVRGPLATEASIVTAGAGQLLKCPLNAPTAMADTVMETIEALRKKHHPQIKARHTTHHSTVGLVVEGCTVGAVVPGGPCDRDFDVGRIEEDDDIVAVDGQGYGAEALPDALRGNDIVGSGVHLKVKKPSGKVFECTVQRGSIARIEAIGELFLMLTEVVAQIQHHKKVTVADIMGLDAPHAPFANCMYCVHSLQEAQLTSRLSSCVGEQSGEASQGCE